MQIKITYRGYKQSLMSKRIIPRVEWVNNFVKIHICTWNVHGSQSETETLVGFICIYWVGSCSDVIHLRCWGALVSCFQCFCRQVCLCFSKVHFSLTFYYRNLVFFPWNLIWNSFNTAENPNLVGVFHDNGSKFQLCNTAQSIISFTWTALPCLYFFSASGSRNNAKYAF